MGSYLTSTYLDEVFSRLGVCCGPHSPFPWTSAMVWGPVGVTCFQQPCRDERRTWFGDCCLMDCCNGRLSWPDRASAAGSSDSPTHGWRQIAKFAGSSVHNQRQIGMLDINSPKGNSIMSRTAFDRRRMPFDGGFPLASTIASDWSIWNTGTRWRPGWNQVDDGG